MGFPEETVVRYFNNIAALIQQTRFYHGITAVRNFIIGLPGRVYADGNFSGAGKTGIDGTVGQPGVINEQIVPIIGAADYSA